jgi:hypothetical protein
MLYRKIIAVCSEIRTKHINKLFGQEVEFLNVKLVVQKVTTGLKMVNIIWKHLPKRREYYREQLTPKKQSPSWEVYSRFNDQEIPHHLWKYSTYT